MQLSEQEVVRREKLTRLRELGINPYPADLFPVDANSKQIKNNFEEGKQVTIAGRLMVINIQGKASFGQFKTAKGEFKYISTEMKFVLEKINLCTILFLKNY